MVVDCLTSAILSILKDVKLQENENLVVAKTLGILKCVVILKGRM